MNNCGIYSIVVRPPNGSAKWYIGHSARLRRRKTEHWTDLKKGLHPNRHLQRAWQKYGPESFAFSVVEYCDETELVEREQTALSAKLRRYGRRRIINIMVDCVRSRKGVKMTPIARSAMRIRSTNLWRDPEFRERTIAAQKIAQASPELREVHRQNGIRIGRSPAMVEMQRTTQRVAQNRPEVKARKSSSIRAALATPESKARRRSTNAKPEVRARRSMAALNREACNVN